MTQPPVADRDLTPTAHARIRTELLTAIDQPRRGRWLAPVAAGVAALSVGGLATAFLAGHGAHHPALSAATTPPPSAAPSAAPPISALARRCESVHGARDWPSGLVAVNETSIGAAGTWVLLENQRNVATCVVDRNGTASPSGSGDLPDYPGGRNVYATPHGRTVSLKPHVVFTTEVETTPLPAAIAGVVGPDIVRVEVRWATGQRLTIPVRNGTYLAASTAAGPFSDHPTVLGYDAAGHPHRDMADPTTPLPRHPTR